MNGSNPLQTALSIALVASALAVAGVLVHREFAGRQTAGSIAVEGWERLTARVPDMGAANARHRIVLFSDYQCPYCRDLEASLSSVVARHAADLAVVRYEYPLRSAHPRAFAAAISAKCGSRQGLRHAFQSRLFEQDLDAVEDDFLGIAKSSGVPDLVAFSRCMKSVSAEGAVKADMTVAERLGIDSVPAFIVDGRLYSGTRDVDALEEIISGAP